jgi:two-component system phosphate regulon sensor histidine kinase PhoR
LKVNRLNIIILLGLVATIGLLIAQCVWTYQAYKIEEKKFSQKTHVALLEVARKLYEHNGHEFSAKDLIQKVTNDYYVVNVNDDIEPAVLEHYLKTEFSKLNIITDYEYAIYNCESDDMMYGKLISISDEPTDIDTKVEFSPYKDLVYYFAIRFPQETSYLIGNLKFWFILSFALVFILSIYVYSIYTLIQHKKYSELQRDFINNMTHEFKTPLSSILLASHSLEKQELVKSNSKLEQYAQIITTQGNKLNQHVDKILNIARNDEFAVKLQPQSLNLEETVQTIVGTFQTKYPNLNIQVMIDPSLNIWADEFHFCNVVQNLLDNSIKYSDGNPKIEIKATSSRKGIELEFKDFGIGVSDKNLTYIFDKFYRVPNSKSSEVTGFGLGLFYVKKIVQQHHWKIVASTNPEKGLIIKLLISNKKK